MMFQGSKHVPRGAYFAMLEAAGATNTNGTTDHDRTNYYETCHRINWRPPLWLESDRMGYLLDELTRRTLHQPAGCGAQ